jgi:hypothetical protein
MECNLYFYDLYFVFLQEPKILILHLELLWAAHVLLSLLSISIIASLGAANLSSGIQILCLGLLQ